jgi:hypothetical protein
MTTFQATLLSHLERLKPGETFIITPTQITENHLTHEWIHQHAGAGGADWKITPQDTSSVITGGAWVSWHLTRTA